MARDQRRQAREAEEAASALEARARASGGRNERRQGGSGDRAAGESRPQWEWRSGAAHRDAVRQSHTIRPFAQADLPEESPALWSEEWGQGGPTLASDGDMKVTLKMVVWLKKVHTIEWSGGTVSGPRPEWVKSPNAYWWCLCCQQQMSGTGSANSHVIGRSHWKKRQNYYPGN